MDVEVHSTPETPGICEAGPRDVVSEEQGARVTGGHGTCAAATHL